MYDDDTGAYIPQEWERYFPAGSRMASGEIAKEGAWESEWEDPTEMESTIAVPVSRISSWMEKGVLPFPGGLLDQPARLLRAVEAWREALHVCDERILKRKGVSSE